MNNYTMSEKLSVVRHWFARRNGLEYSQVTAKIIAETDENYTLEINKNGKISSVTWLKVFFDEFTASVLDEHIYD